MDTENAASIQMAIALSHDPIMAETWPATRKTRSPIFQKYLAPQSKSLNKNSEGILTCQH